MRGALVAGALLAFGLSFDEIIVTTFTAGAGEQTLPIWIFTNFSRPNQLPIVNVVAVIVILLSLIPVYAAYRLTRDEDGVGDRGRGSVGGTGAGRGGGGRGPGSGSGWSRARVVSGRGRRAQAGPEIAVREGVRSVVGHTARVSRCGFGVDSR